MQNNLICPYKDEGMIMLRVAGAQIPISQDIRTNYEIICQALDIAVDKKCDILLTPEGALSGYTPNFDNDQARMMLEKLVARAKAGNLGLALGTCLYESDGRCYNQLRFYDQTGRFLGFHSKILLVGSLIDQNKGEHMDYASKPIETYRFKGITIGGLICNDLWANPGCTPALDQILVHKLANMGARIIFHAVNGYRDNSYFSQQVTRRFHESNLLMRAGLFNVCIATVDNCYPQDISCSAQGGVISTKGRWLCKSKKKGMDVYICDVPISD